MIENEIKVMKGCKGRPNVVEYFDTFKTDRSLLIVMEHCSDGSMKSYIETKQNKKRLT